MNGVLESGSFDANRVVDSIQITQYELQRPFMLLKPTMFQEDGKWVCYYGQGRISGVTGVGENPDAASRDFDDKWMSGKAKD